MRSEPAAPSARGEGRAHGSAVAAASAGVLARRPEDEGSRAAGYRGRAPPAPEGTAWHDEVEEDEPSD